MRDRIENQKRINTQINLKEVSETEENFPFQRTDLSEKKKEYDLRKKKKKEAVLVVVMVAIRCLERWDIELKQD